MKSVKFNISLILLFLLVFSDCKKQELGKKHLNGKITEEGSSVPVVNAKIELREYVYNNNSLHTDYKILQTAYTDANGNYSFDFEWKDYANWYNLDIKTNDCETKVEGYDISSSKKNNIRHDISLTPFAILRVHVIGDKGNYQLRIITDAPKYFWSQGDDEYVNLITYGNKNNTLYYSIQDTVGSKPYTFTYFVKAHETYDYTIEF